MQPIVLTIPWPLVFGMVLFSIACGVGLVFLVIWLFRRPKGEAQATVAPPPMAAWPTQPPMYAAPMAAAVWYPYCYRCGAQNVSGFRFCPNCGAML